MNFFPGSRLIDIFSRYFLFHWASYKNKESKASYIYELNNAILNISSNSNSVIVASDASIRNNVATSITHIHLYSNLIRKTIHHTVNIITTEAKLFAIRYGINQAIQILNTSHIIFITNFIHLAQHIFDFSIYLYQQQSIVISKHFKAFFNKNSSDLIKFWDWPSDSK